MFSKGLQNSTSATKLRQDNNEADRIVEARREEHRLKKHLELPSSAKPQMHQNSGNNIGLSHSSSTNSYHATESEHMLSTSDRPQKHVQFMSESSPPSVIISPSKSHQNGLKLQQTSSSSSSDQLDSSPSTPPPPLPTQPQPKRVMFSDTSKLLEFDQDQFGTVGKNDNTPSVIGANEIYVDQRLKIKQQQQQQQQLAQMVIEGEKLSFKDKMRLFAKQSGGESTGSLSDADTRLKVSRKQREIESKFDK
jgi:hypothetical protein